MHCSGNGHCLTARGKLICERKCAPISCYNFEICRNEEPEFILMFHSGVCRECYSKFGPSTENPNLSNPRLEIEYATEECPVCLEICELRVKCPRCIHWICASCINIIFSNDFITFTDPPKFPLSSEEELLFQSKPELFFMDEAIQNWKRKYQRWETNRIKYVCKKRKYIKHCPICRS